MQAASARRVVAELLLLPPYAVEGVCAVAPEVCPLPSLSREGTASFVIVLSLPLRQRTKAFLSSNLSRKRVLSVRSLVRRTWRLPPPPEHGTCPIAWHTTRPILAAASERGDVKLYDVGPAVRLPGEPRLAPPPPPLLPFLTLSHEFQRKVRCFMPSKTSMFAAVPDPLAYRMTQTAHVAADAQSWPALSPGSWAFCNDFEQSVLTMHTECHRC
jgi:hypothetical protein